VTSCVAVNIYAAAKVLYNVLALLTMEPMEDSVSSSTTSDETLKAKNAVLRAGRMGMWRTVHLCAVRLVCGGSNYKVVGDGLTLSQLTCIFYGCFTVKFVQNNLPEIVWRGTDIVLYNTWQSARWRSGRQISWNRESWYDSMLQSIG
jgi:hypothetical protein